MSAGSATALAGGIAGGVIAVVVLALLVRLVVAVTKLGGVTRELVRAVEDLRSEGPGDVEATEDVAENGHRPTPTRMRLDLGLSGPVIKARALGRGTSEAARRLRHGRPGGPVRQSRKEP
jgi:hypothetical protein